ncbi:helicase-related protein [Fictibacillus sp. FJAT-27399]|uniref:helicase-related protein n=1 Tax=Fictibacillus sp. FJAT-27399 TaxID=1729689 RepID=UPI0007818E31|nr:helicase-related protein [Fictibacillus sp. FJAT-27399]
MLNSKNKELFLNHILLEFLDEIKGSNKDRIIGNHPEEEILVGKLSPINIKSDIQSSTTNISRIGMDFFINTETLENGSITIIPSGNFYYRVFPLFQEQKDYCIKKATELYKMKFTDVNEIENYLRDKNDQFMQEVIDVYKKIKIEDVKIKLNFLDIFNQKNNIGYFTTQENNNNEVFNFLEKVKKEILNDKNSYRLIRDNMKLNSIKNSNSWEKFLGTYGREFKVPTWDFGIDCEIKKTGEYYKVSINLFNLTETDGHKKDKVRINTLFDSGIEIKVQNGNIIPIELPYFEDDYKYDKRQKAIGHNCTVEEKDNILKTTHLPVFEQKRLKTRDDIKITFQQLYKEPVSSLEGLANEMDKEYSEWVADYNQKVSDKSLSSRGEKKFQEEINDFLREINRFKNGIRVIKNFNLIKEAFINMNMAFSKSAKGYASWRLFQLVFVVSLIPDICTSEYSEDEMGPTNIDLVDLLYFPTGGGKTEAFLGVTIFTLFFDRLRDKNAGVSAIIKYPLRLLSVQQVQRLADILAMAELIRKQHPDMQEGETFSLGYFVGDNNTPNKITETVAQKFINTSIQDLTDEYKVIDICPYCRSKDITVLFNEHEHRLEHKCNNSNCSSSGVLPFYMVDREIYRYLPSVIISTIDKFASIGVQSDFRNILGEIQIKCDKHGYSSKLCCTEREQCNDISTLKKINLKDAAPTIFIQDELHLIRESLGVYDSHYESLIQYYIKNLSSSKKRIKIIGATATISAYQEQCHHLYLKDPIRFPSESPYLNKNFYAQVDENDQHRKIIGYAPFGKAIINSVVYSLKYMKVILWKYFMNPELIQHIPGIQVTGKDDSLKILEDYWIFLQYNNVKLDGNKVLSALDDPINTELDKENIQSFDSRKMTGDDSFQDVRRILAEVESTPDVFKGLNLITATNMISHGVDADRFNLMFFFGMPNNTAEYIQAYSRVGRKHPGAVFMIMRPSREKDQSYLKNFVKFHEFKDILVEPVPINRWATKAIERTFPGVFSALLLNYFDYKLQNEINGNIYMMSKLQKATLDGLIDSKEVVEHLKGAFQSNSNSIGKIYDQWIDNSVNEFFRRLKFEDFNPKNKKDAYLTEGFERLGFLKPMNSLRDTDTPIIVEMK